MRNRMVQISRINEMAADPEAFIFAQEQSYRRRIGWLADDILAQGDGERMIVMLSGPSGSGKTTTAIRLAQELEKRGSRAVTISLDNFYLGEGRSPRLENGEEDYESVHALNLPQLHECMMRLLDSGECELPHFNFQLARPDDFTVHVSLESGDVAIVEGIHAMNPEITDTLPQECLKKLYVSVKTDVYNGDELLLPTRNMRLIRRMTRDNLFRNAPPARTLSMWPGVLEGERKYIRPYKDTADYFMNTFHYYEPCMFRDSIIGLLRTVKPEDFGYETASLLADRLTMFASVSESLVPKESMLREFIGGSDIEY